MAPYPRSRREWPRTWPQRQFDHRAVALAATAAAGSAQAHAAPEPPGTATVAAVRSAHEHRRAARSASDAQRTCPGRPDRRAVAGKADHVDLTRGYLSSRLGVSERTMARLLAQLRAYDYIATVQTIGNFGETTGLRVALLDPLLPYWETEPPVVVGEGVPKASGRRKLRTQRESEELAARHPVLAYPRYRRARGGRIGRRKPRARPADL